MCTSKNELELLSILRPKMDNENIQTVFLSAENGYPCETNKVIKIDNTCSTLTILLKLRAKKVVCIF